MNIEIELTDEMVNRIRESTITNKVFPWNVIRQIAEHLPDPLLELELNDGWRRHSEGVAWFRPGYEVIIRRGGRVSVHLHDGYLWTTSSKQFEELRHAVAFGKAIRVAMEEAPTHNPSLI